ncbi:hypothetical protein IWQ61_010253 [Dispira simplex]|nr:hypothetical protein IWQ61_010253 [Dispira simplex]
MTNETPVVNVENIKAEKTYHPKDWTTDSLKNAGFGMFAGFAVSAYLNAVHTHKAGAAGVITRTGYLMPLFAVLGGIFTATEGLAANYRQEDDYLNSMLAGGVAGFLAGARRRSLPIMIGCAFTMSMAMGAYKYFGSLTDPFAGRTKEELKKKRREYLRLE